MLGACKHTPILGGSRPALVFGFAQGERARVQHTHAVVLFALRACGTCAVDTRVRSFARVKLSTTWGKDLGGGKGGRLVEGQIYPPFMPRLQANVCLNRESSLAGLRERGAAARPGHGSSNG
eukprot:scaffold41475_cov18-Tisochrysis_lutea.AAC.1